MFEEHTWIVGAIILAVVKETAIFKGYTWIVGAIILAVVVVALVAIAKGRGFSFSARRGETRLEMDITGKQGDALEPSGESDTIKDVSVLEQGKIENSSNVNIHIGHKVEKAQD